MAIIASTLSPLGGVLVAPAALAAPSPLLADDIDPNTRDYRSLFTGVHPTDAAAQFALGTTRGSGSAVNDVGMAPLPSKLDDGAALLVESHAREALGRLIKLGDLRLNGVRMSADEPIQAGILRVQYVNLRLGPVEPKTVTLEPRAFPGGLSG